MGMYWLGYDTGNVGKDTFVVTEQVNYLTYVETNTPKYKGVGMHFSQHFSMVLF
jgi:hypothetical protein